MSTASAESLPLLKLRHGEDRRLRSGHLWVFSNEVDIRATPLTSFEPGALARVVSDRDHFLGYAYVNPATLIAARIVSRSLAQPVGPALFDERLRRALALRERLFAQPYFRWVYGESDGLPGLVLDRFGDVVVGQIATLGMQRLKPEIEASVRRVLAPAVLFWKNDTGARTLESLPSALELAWGEAPAELQIVESRADGLTIPYRASFSGGQKTGWFFDQSANRAALARYVAPGARVLDVCSYAGAWAIAALQAGAASATCVDASQGALDQAQVNARLNGVELASLRGDAFEALAALADAGERFDVVIVDPPAFIKRRKEFPQGVAAYRKLNQLALRLIERDGILVSCSCSWHLGSDDLLGAIQGAARHVDRFVQLLQAGGQSPDHPVHPAIPETRYLKTFFCRVARE